MRSACLQVVWSAPVYSSPNKGPPTLRRDVFVAIRVDFACAYWDDKNKMPGRLCSFPNCPNKITSVTLRSLSFHRLPTADEVLMKRWLLALQMDPNTPADIVKREDHKICSVHFDLDDFYPRKAQPAPVKKRRRGLRKTKPLKEHFERTKLKPHAVPKSCLLSKPEVIFTIVQMLLSHLFSHIFSELYNEFGLRYML